jgi:hypothetical protein
MRRLMSPVFVVAVSAAGLLALGGASAARAEVATGPFEQLVAAWMGVVGVIGADEEMEDETALAEPFADETDENTFVIDDEGDDSDEGEEGEEKAKPHRERRDRDRGEGGRRHHRGGHPHGDHGHRDHGHGGPHMGGRHHPGMGPGRMGSPGGPDMHHPAMRAFHEIIRRLARIEEKLGIEDAPPSGPHGDHPRHPRPEMHRPRGPAGSAEQPMPRLDIPEEMRRKMEERMQEGRRRMEEAKGRMDEARKRFQAMEERVKQLEAEVERLKAAK